MARQRFALVRRAIVAGVVAAGTLAGAAHAQIPIGIALGGANERPNPGSPTGAGTASVTVEPAANRVCYELSVMLSPPATGAHIHRGRVDEAGPIVVPFDPPSGGTLQGDPPDGGRSRGCVEGLDAALVADMAQNPSGFYVNIHNAEFPAGALRGQLG